MLRRPELGRKHSAEAAATIRRRCAAGIDLQVAIGDGLSAAAVIAQVPTLLPLLELGARERRWSFGQPYVVRLFGSKENLFLATIEEALDRMLASFRAALADTDAPREPGITDEKATAKRIGQAYVDLLAVRGLHQTLAHAYLLGSHAAIGAAARKGFATVWRFFRDEMGLEADEARAFMAEGMLISTMIGLRIVDDYGSDPQITELFRSCFPTELPHVLEVLPRGTERW